MASKPKTYIRLAVEGRLRAGRFPDTKGGIQRATDAAQEMADRLGLSVQLQRVPASRASERSNHSLTSFAQSLGAKVVEHPSDNRALLWIPEEKAYQWYTRKGDQWRKKGMRVSLGERRSRRAAAPRGVRGKKIPKALRRQAGAHGIPVELRQFADGRYYIVAGRSAGTLSAAMRQVKAFAKNPPLSGSIRWPSTGVVIDTAGPASGEFELRETPCLRGACRARAKKGTPGTVELFLVVLTSKLVQYDQRETAKELKRGYSTNIYRLGHLMAAANKVGEDVADVKDRSDKAALDQLKASMNRHFIKGFPPVKQVDRQIDAWLEKGRAPRLQR